MADKLIKVEDSPGGSRMNTVQEGATVSQEPHGHPFKVKFNQKDSKECNVFCEKPCTVLQAIKTLDEYKKMVTGADENIIIQMGTGDNESSIATHFPCSCIGHDEVLTISSETEAVEKAQHDLTGKIYTRDKYSVFYIDKEGGKNTKTKVLFKNNAVKDFKYLCVYGEKEITVKEALKRDGRFIDTLFEVNFELIENQNSVFECKHKLGKIDNKKFKICLPWGKNTKTKVKLEEQIGLSSPLASEGSQTKNEIRSVLNVAQQRDISVKQAVIETGSSIDPRELYKLLCEQFPHLKKHMEMRFPGNSLPEALKLRKENFGKIGETFSEVHRVRELIELANSVCLLQVHISDSSTVQGTGFVLFDNFVLTNAHLFNYWVNSGLLNNWWESVNVTAVFDFEKQESDKKTVKAKVFVGNKKLDYAILKLETEPAPPGLLKRLGPLPSDGGACIVGHPAGGVKKMAPTCIIEKKKQQEADNINVEDDNINVEEHRQDFITIYGINQAIENDPYKNICVTYKTGTMYNGSSGSPVFDAHGRVFGLHSGGFFYGIPKADECVLEYAIPLLTILENFVGNLKEPGYEKLLERIEEEGKGIPHLDNIIATVVGPKQSRPEEILETETADCEESMEFCLGKDPPANTCG